MQRIAAKKGIGQHFLIDKNIARKIVESFIPDNFNTFIEIGPGTGVLTRIILEKNYPNFTAIDLDRESVDYLNSHFPEHKNKFVYGDFLKYPLEQYKGPIALIGNLPFFISSQIFFRVLEYPHKVNQMVFTVQKEVAERIAAKPGNKTYGILSVLLQAYYNIEYLFTIHEKCFAPPPKVKSAVIRLMRNNTKELNCRYEMFHKIIKTAFNQRRKVIRNSLKSIFLNLPTESELLSKRPEQLTVDQFAELTRYIDSLNP